VILADTDVLIDFLAGVQPVASRMAAYAAPGRLQTSAVNSFELLSGAGEGRRAEFVRQLLAAVPILPRDRDESIDGVGDSTARP
jgi:predicted nucleic acid-binding protein